MSLFTIGKGAGGNRRVVRVNATELTEVDVTHISLVKNAANRIPFRVVKSEDDEMGINLNGGLDLGTLFRRKTENDRTIAPVPAVVGIVVKNVDIEGLRKPIEDLGYKILDVVALADTDLSVLKTAEYDDDKPVVLFKMNEHIAVLVENIGDEVQKTFMGFSESSSFKENLSQSGFFPGMRVATEVLMETVGNIMFTADEGEPPTESVEKALNEYSDHVKSLVTQIPQTAFKLEGIAPAKKDEAAPADADATDATVEGKDPATEGETAPAAAAAAAEGETDTSAAAGDEANPLADAIVKMAGGLTAMADKFDAYAASTDKKLEEISKGAETRLKAAEEAAAAAERKLKGTVVVEAPSVGDGGIRTMHKRKQEGGADGDVFGSAIRFDGFESANGGHIEHYD